MSREFDESVDGRPMQSMGGCYWMDEEGSSSRNYRDEDGREWCETKGLYPNRAPTTFIGKRFWIESFIGCRPHPGYKGHSVWHVPAICDAVRSALWRFKWRRELAFNAAQEADPANNMAWAEVRPRLWRCPLRLVESEWMPVKYGEVADYGARYAA